eukprot:9444917-Alexandrium_andersonii.AAC.1
MCIRDSHNASPNAGGAARSAEPLEPLPLESGAPMCCKSRAAERAVWPATRAGTATSVAGCWGPGQL